METKNKSFSHLTGKRLLRTALSIAAMVLNCSIAYAQSEASDFEVVNGVPVAYHGAGGSVVIPDDLGITKIGDNAFYQNASITSVSIPEGVAEIGNNAFPEIEITHVKIAPAQECYVSNNNNIFTSYAKTPYYEGTVLKDPIEIIIEKVCSSPVKVKYSLYTLNKDFLEKGDGYCRYDRLSELWSDRIDEPLRQKTQADIDKNLEKIYEFPVVTETPDETQRILEWDGKTDAMLTGKSLPVRACLHLAAHDAETGELIAIILADNLSSQRIGLETYAIDGSPIIRFTVDTDEYGKETLSANIFWGFDDRPVRLTAFIGTSSCKYGNPTYYMVNKGAEAMIAAIIASVTDFYPEEADIIAYKELTNPAADPDNNLIKVYEWKDIQKINWNDQKWKDLLKNAGGGFMGTNGWPWTPMPELDGDYFVPDRVAYFEGEYKPDKVWFDIGIIVEALDDEGNPIETFTGINEGFVLWFMINGVPTLSNPKQVGNTEIGTDNRIIIGADGNGNFAILCNDVANAPESYAIVNMVGQTVKAGSLSGLHRENITASNLHPGVYFITVNRKGGVNYTQKLIIK